MSEKRNGPERCRVCGEKFATRGAKCVHEEDHVLRISCEDPLILSITAAKREDIERRFARGVAELRKWFPGKRFQFVPFLGRWDGKESPAQPRVRHVGSFGSPSTPATFSFTTWLAVEDPEGQGEPRPRIAAVRSA